LFGLYLWFFLLNTRKRVLIQPKAINLVLLGIQSTATLCVSLILLLLTDVLVGFLLPTGWGVLWIFVHSIADFLITLYSPKNGLIQQWHQFSNQTPLPVEAFFSLLSSIAAQFFCFSIGKMGALELRQRLELSRINAELQATRQLQAESVRLAERVYISREIHDSLGHYLTALSLNLQLASRLANPEAKKPLEESHLLTKLLLSDVRDVVSALRGNVALDLSEALKTLVSGIQTPKIDLQINGDGSGLEPAQANTLFRCVQEGVTNAIRHSRAQHVWIRLDIEPDAYRLTIRDDGRGGSGRRGNGLTGMAERIDSLNGTLAIDTRPGEGFCIRVEIPNVERIA
jgi:signal transduction histidine kinase